MGQTFQKSRSKNQSSAQILTHSQTITFTGPIPAPEILAKYEALQSGLAHRIVKMAEEQSEHRRALEAMNLQAQVQHIKARDVEARWGQWFAFTLGVLTIFTGAYLVGKGFQVSGTIFGGGGLAVIVSAFIYGTKKENK